MKNYKHVSKNINGMKLAAVASAAVMLAPVAMTSVSSFAAGYTSDYTNYPVFQIVPYQTALNAGTNGQIGDPYIGFNTSDVTSAIAAVDAINTGADQGNYIDQTSTLKKASDVTTQAASDLVAGLKNGKADSWYAQLTAANKKAADVNIATISSKKSAIDTQVSKAYNALWGAATAADSAVTADNANPTQTNDALVQTTAANYASAVTTFKNAIQNYTSLTTAVTNYSNAIARKTNNGAVQEAAQNAAVAISKLPAADQPAAKASFLKIQGDYITATKNNNANFGGAAAVKAMDAAAATAVKALNDLADSNYDKSTSKQVGVAKVNYNPNYGIQIWTKDGKPVRYNSVEAAATGHKNGDAKKLPGGKSYKVFNATYTANGTTYYNLGGDQYIDAAYVTVTK